MPLWVRVCGGGPAVASVHPSEVGRKFGRSLVHHGADALAGDSGIPQREGTGSMLRRPTVGRATGKGRWSVLSRSCHSASCRC